MSWLLLYSLLLLTIGRYVPIFLHLLSLAFQSKSDNKTTYYLSSKQMEIENDNFWYPCRLLFQNSGTHFFDIYVRYTNLKLSKLSYSQFYSHVPMVYITQKCVGIHLKFKLLTRSCTVVAFHWWFKSQILNVLISHLSVHDLPLNRNSSNEPHELDLWLLIQFSS